MIPRYSRPEMAAIWSPESKFQIWFEIEAHACDAQAKLGVIPEEAAREVWEKGAFEVARIDEIERETHHDVIAFLTNLAEYVGPSARFVHQGMTSSDVLDTCFSVQLVRATDILLDDMERLLAALRRRAHEHKGSAIVEVYQNCNVFNDGAFAALTKRDARAAMLINLEHGKPVRFGADNERGVVIDNDGAKIVEVADVGEDALYVHDESALTPGQAFALSRLASDRQSPTPVGVFRAVERSEYGEAVSGQLAVANEKNGPGDLNALLHSLPTWEVS